MYQLGATDPQRVGPYTLLGRLGAGGMGAVYLGRSSAGRTVAVKVVRPELAGDVEFRDRFRAEVSAAQAVSGAFTAPVVDADPEAAMPWMATAFVAGVSLSQAVATRGPLPESSLWMFASGVAEALADIHRAKLIHRDLKPSNVLLAPDGPHVIDFGITRAMDGAAQLTATGAVVGSPGYMSPEQVLGQPLGPESDMFSLGATLVYAATGRNAYGEGAPQSLLFRVTNSEPDPGTMVLVPASLRDAVTACLDRDPARRPTTRQLVDYIDRLTPVAAGGSWLPPALTADVVAAGAVVTGDSPPFGVAGAGTGTAGFGSAGTGGTAGAPTMPYAYGGVPGTTAPHGGGPGSGPGGPKRRNVLLAAGGAVVLAGAGTGIAVMASGGTAKANKTPPGTPTPTSPASPSPDPSTSPTSTLPPAAGSTGTMAGPTAKVAWTVPLTEESRGLQLSGSTLVNLTLGTINGCDAATGKSKWAKPLAIKGGQMLAVGDTVYAAGRLPIGPNGTIGLCAIDPGSGAMTWNTPLPHDNWVPSSISGVQNGVVFVEGNDYTSAPVTSWMWVYDSASHKELWRQVGSAAGSACVPAAGNKIFVGTDIDTTAGIGQIQAYDAATGAKGWTLSVNKGATFSIDGSAEFAMGSGSLIYMADHMYAVDPATNKQNWAWTPPATETLFSMLGVSPDGTTVAVYSDSGVYAVDAKTGQQKWTTVTADKSGLQNIDDSPPQLIDGNVYVPDAQNTIWALDPATGATRWKYSFPAAVQWVAGGGYVYAAYGKTLVAIRSAGQ